MRLKDVVILVAPVILSIVAVVLTVIPGVIIPAEPPLSPPPPVVAVPTPGAGGAAASASPVAAAAPTTAAAAQGGGNTTGASSAPAATAVPTVSQAGAPGAPAAKGNPDHGKELIVQKGCSGCHTIAGVPGAVGKVGPELSHIGTEAATMEPGKDAEAYIRESIENPAAFTVPGFPAGVMPPKLVQGQDEDDVVAFLLQLK